jgi:NAD-dependent SIR2 family protein deacetylase
MAGNSKNLRCSQPGELLPDILLNDEVTELWKNGKRIDQLAIQDTRCHVLLIIGTRLKPKGASSLVKAMASQIQHFGGTVVYVDWHTLAPSSWAKYINLHIQMDIEMWANGCLKELNSVRVYLHPTDEFNSKRLVIS